MYRMGGGGRNERCAANAAVRRASIRRCAATLNNDHRLMELYRKVDKVNPESKIVYQRGIRYDLFGDNNRDTCAKWS